MEVRFDAISEACAGSLQPRILAMELCKWSLILGLVNQHSSDSHPEYSFITTVSPRYLEALASCNQVLTMKASYLDRMGSSQLASEQRKRTKLQRAGTIATGVALGQRNHAPGPVSSRDDDSSAASSWLVTSSRQETAVPSRDSERSTADNENSQRRASVGDGLPGGDTPRSPEMLRNLLLTRDMSPRDAYLQDLVTSELIARRRHSDLLMARASLGLPPVPAPAVGALPNRLLMEQLLASRQQTLPGRNFRGHIASPSATRLSFPHNQLNDLVRLQLLRGTTDSNMGLPIDNSLLQAPSRFFTGGVLPDLSSRQMSQTAPFRAPDFMGDPVMDERVHTLRLARSGNTMSDSATPGVTFEGEKITPVSLAAEDAVMSDYQCLLRQQIVFVETHDTKNGGKTQGRNKPLVKGQVGILCRHCARLPSRNHTRGTVYFPARLNRIYQAAQNMAHNHFVNSCMVIPEITQRRLVYLKEQKAVTVGAGKEYWVKAAKAVGVEEREEGLFFTQQRKGDESTVQKE